MAKEKSMQNEVCPECGKVHGKRKNLDKMCTNEELDNLKLIRNKISCADQAINPVAIPCGVEKEQIKVFISAAIDVKSEALFLQQMWWEEMVKKYSLPRNTYVDFTDGTFYNLESPEKECKNT